MSIDIVNIFTGIFLFIFTIYGSRFLRYNKAIMEEVSAFAAPQEGGKHRGSIKGAAEARGESVNGFVNRAISEAMERDNGAPAASEGLEKEKPQA